MKKHYQILLILLFFSGACAAQEDVAPVKLKRHAVHVTGGTFLISVHGMAHYDFRVWGRPNQFFQSIWVGAGAGPYALIFDNSGMQYTLKSTLLFGSKEAHLDIGIAGVAIKENEEENHRFMPGGHIGFRYQKPEGHFIFRTGVGFPEGAFVGFGFAF